MELCFGRRVVISGKCKEPIKGQEVHRRHGLRKTGADGAQMAEAKGVVWETIRILIVFMSIVGNKGYKE